MQKTSTLISFNTKSIKNNPQPHQNTDDFEPSPSIIQNILNYSKSLTVKKSNSVGFIEIVAS